MLVPSPEADCTLTVVENGVETQMPIPSWPRTLVHDKLVKGKHVTLRWICLSCRCDNGDVLCVVDPNCDRSRYGF